jgi:membrane protease YdiL (CAAX protease family)
MSEITATPVVQAAVTPVAYHQLARTWAGRWRLRPVWAVLLGVVFYGVELALAVVAAVVLAALGVPIPTALVEGDLTNWLDPAVFAIGYLMIAAMLPAIWLAFAVVGRRPGLLSSVSGGLRWRWLARAGLAALAIWAVTVSVGIVADLAMGRPIGAGVPQLGLWLLLVVLITPLQAAAEEYVFRGALAQLVGTWLRHPAWAILLPVPLFVVGHAYNWVGLIDVALFAVAAGWLTWRTGGLEAAIVMHAVNNTVLNIAAGFGLTDPNQVEIDPMSLVMGLLPVAAFVGWVEWRLRQRPVSDERERPDAARAPAVG